MLLIVLVVSLPMLTRLFPQQVSLPLWPGKCSVLLNWWLFVQVYSIIITLSLPLSSSEYSPRWDYLLISSSLHHSRRWYFYLAIINLPSFLPPLPHTRLHGKNIQALPPRPTSSWEECTVFSYPTDIGWTYDLLWTMECEWMRHNFFLKHLSIH